MFKKYIKKIFNKIYSMCIYWSRNLYSFFAYGFSKQTVVRWHKSIEIIETSPRKSYDSETFLKE